MFLLATTQLRSQAKKITARKSGGRFRNRIENAGQ